VQARFLLGPAGSGKTFRCVEELRKELLCSSDGPPLIFLAPKQATFQIERQLLEDGGLKGYSRLQILSFERLAVFVFDQLGLPLPELISEEGRVMVLRALLARHHAELKIFRASARLTGFAGQLCTVLRELQRSHVSPAKLTALAQKIPAEGRLADKLHDLALLMGCYESWLAERRDHGHHLDDSNRLLDLAVTALREAETQGRQLNLGAMWLDGFAEMTPQEIALMAAVLPHCNQATLAFCLDGEPEGETSWLSPWTVVGRTFARCRDAVAQATQEKPIVELLLRDLQRSRFQAAPALLQLEKAWASGGNAENVVKIGGACAEEAVRLVSCPSPEAEAMLAAREILRHVQARGRLRDCAILVRSLEGYHDVLRRVLGRYDIPFFLDRREAVAHHPLAELTRYALRTAAFDWRQEDWFGALKSGLTGVADAEVDWLENEALKRGWIGETWRHPLVIADDSKLAERLEVIRRCVMPAFEKLSADCRGGDSGLTGQHLATALRDLWKTLDVEAQLEGWMEAASRLNVVSAAHPTVWRQLSDWLGNMELAFAGETLTLREWLPVIEAGLAGMTVGVIPPSLDQVLVGSVDRSRNPDLQTVIVLGVNEGVFPAPPAPGILLTDSDRLELEAHGLALGSTQRQQLGHERYFGYIAFTRARRTLLVTWATADEEGDELNPSPFVNAIRRAVPAAKEEAYYAPHWQEALHRIELPQHILGVKKGGGAVGLVDLPEFQPLIRRWDQSHVVLRNTHLSPSVAQRLYGNELNSSVSSLEDFVACPFRFVAARALRTQERDEFVVDVRQMGSFQHEVLETFHERARSLRRRWRDLTPGEARQWVREIGEELAASFEGGLMVADDARRFTTALLINNLECLMETLIGWAPQYAFDPTEVEVSFGLEGAQLPAWSMALSGGRILKLRGRIDRIDIARDSEGGALVVICDYKSSGKEMDAVKVEAGLELQLLSYIAALAQMPEARAWLKTKSLQPAGVFYVPLRGRPGTGATRDVATEKGSELASAFQHRGRFDGARLSMFDSSGASKGVQFRFKLNKGGEFAKVGNEGMPPGEFAELVGAAEAKLRTVAEQIFNGEAGVAPFRLKGETACDWCAYRSVCRFDPWTMSFRSLNRSGEVGE